MTQRRVLAIANQKGGVGKTTTTLNLGAELVNRGRTVVLVDCDPQHSLTVALGVDAADSSLAEVLGDHRPGSKKVSEVIRKTNEAGIHSRGYLMIGCPGETAESIEKTTRFTRESGLKDFHVTFCTPMPGAGICAMAISSS